MGIGLWLRRTLKLKNMNEQEKICLQKTVELHNALCELDFAHEAGGSPNDMLENTFHIHAIQNYIFAREGIKNYRLNNVQIVQVSDTTKA